MTIVKNIKKLSIKNYYASLLIISGMANDEKKSVKKIYYPIFFIMSRIMMGKNQKNGLTKNINKK